MQTYTLTWIYDRESISDGKFVNDTPVTMEQARAIGFAVFGSGVMWIETETGHEGIAASRIRRVRIDPIVADPNAM